MSQASANVASLVDRPPADATAVRLPERDVSYGELRAAVGEAAAELATGGVGLGTRVFLRLPDDLSRLVCSLAVQRLGAVSLAVNPATIGAELEHMIEHSDPGAAICSPELAEPFEGAGGGLWTVTGAALESRRRCPAPARPGPTGPGDPASLLFTSGSSALPRLVVTSHRAHLAMARDLATLLDARPADSFLALAPLFHVAGWSTAVLPALAAGASLVMPGPFSASRFWADVERWQPTIWTTGLAFIEMVAARGGPPPATTPFRHVVSNLRPDTWQLGRERLGLPLGTYYGLTENTGRGTIALSVDEYSPGFVGRPYTAADGVRVVADGEPVEPGAVGEIELRGESTMSEYFRDPDATAAVLRPGGWVATGDLGTLDERGDLFFRGRIKNMIKRSGENISAEEVELVLLGHEQIADATVVAVADRVREEEVKAIVVPSPGATLDPERIHDFCAERIAEFKVPRYIQIAESLPRTVSGKPDIGAIRRTMATPEGSWDGAARHVH